MRIIAPSLDGSNVEKEATGPAALSSTALSFAARAGFHGVFPTRSSLETLQINVGKLCNQSCGHCHVGAGPGRLRENMSQETAEKLVELARSCDTLRCVDLTGGAPEMNPSFRYLVREFRSMGLEVIDRCNLTVLLLPGQEDTAQFLAENGVTVVASLPCYSQDNVDAQRGSGVFEGSISALRTLNALGYGKAGTGLKLNLVYNPVGPHLPPRQGALEADYKKLLWDNFGLEFNHLFCITNMPIKRFLDDLKRQGGEEGYMDLLRDNFCSSAAEGVMCKTLISVGWNGEIYDCDFNQMLDMPVGNRMTSVYDLEDFTGIQRGQVAVGDHCFGCTAGEGSSCTGSTV